MVIYVSTVPFSTLCVIYIYKTFCKIFTCALFALKPLVLACLGGVRVKKLFSLLADQNFTSGLYQWFAALWGRYVFSLPFFHLKISGAVCYYVTGGDGMTKIKTGISIDPELLEQAKSYAGQIDRTVSWLIGDALRARLQQEQERQQWHWTTSSRYSIGTQRHIEAVRSSSTIRGNECTWYT